MFQAGRKQRSPAGWLTVVVAAACLSGCATPWMASNQQRRETFFRGERELETPSRPSEDNGVDTMRPQTPNGDLPSPPDNGKPQPTGPKGPAIPRAATPSDVKLELNVVADKRKQVGMAATFRVVLKNVGEKAVDGLAVDCDFEKPLVFPGHPDSIARRTVGTLLPGEQSEMALSLVSDKTGTFCCEFTVHSGGKELLWKSVCVTYVPRRTSLQIFAPKTRTVGGRAETTLLFANVGKTELKEVTVVASFDGTILKPFEFSHGARAQQLQTQSTLTWKWRSLRPGEGIPLQIEFSCLAAAAQACVRVAVSSDEAPEIDATACLNVVPQRGDWDIRIGDAVDPAKVGDETAVTVSIGNRGRVAARPGNLLIDIPANFRVISSSVWQGRRQLPIKSITKGAQVQFERPLPLAPNTQISYRVRVKALREGNTAFRATLLDDTGSPLLNRDEPVSISR